MEVLTGHMEYLESNILLLWNCETEDDTDSFCQPIKLNQLGKKPPVQSLLLLMPIEFEHSNSINTVNANMVCNLMFLFTGVNKSVVVSCLSFVLSVFLALCLIGSSHLCKTTQICFVSGIGEKQFLKNHVML